jgi:predicted dehydrogenase
MKWSGGGQLNDSGSHLVDIVLWMTGLRPREVFAYQENLDAEVDILSAISVEFESGALCNFSVVGHAVNFHEEITLFCDECTLGIRGPDVWRWDDETKQVITADDLGESSNPDVNFIAALRGTEQIQATVADAVGVARFSEAVWSSAAGGQPVRLSD